MHTVDLKSAPSGGNNVVNTYVVVSEYVVSRYPPELLQHGWRRGTMLLFSSLGGGCCQYPKSQPGLWLAKRRNVHSARPVGGASSPSERHNILLLFLVQSNLVSS